MSYGGLTGGVTVTITSTLETWNQRIFGIFAEKNK